MRLIREYHGPAVGNTSEEQMAKMMACMGPLEGITDNFRGDG